MTRAYESPGEPMPLFDVTEENRVRSTRETYTRETSVQAWEYIQETGILGKRRTQAYGLLYQHGPLTGGELSALSGIPGLWKRLSELEEMKLIRIVGERACNETGHNCFTWDVTSKVPSKPYKSRKKKHGRCPECGR